jgi:hypothetical protein
MAGHAGAPAWVLQILIAPKGADPTALTAEEAIRHLLGWGDRLISLRRRTLHEFRLHAPAGEAPVPLIDLAAVYLTHTLWLWNSNKHRAWIRLLPPGQRPETWEVRPGLGLNAGGFGAPALEAGEYDHLLLWNQEMDAAPEDLAAAWPGWRTPGYRKGQLYTVQWQGMNQQSDRARWTEEVGPVTSRGAGLLVQPHFQDWRRFSGAVPIPAWSAA